MAKNTAEREHTRRGGHAAADQVLVRWSMDFNCTSLYTWKSYRK